jgi:DNA-binding LacI/PurR family transcriptional regulator
MSVTIKDVASKANVSVATVSRVINNIQPEKVSASTRERVIETISKMGYRPNLTARSLSKQITSHIGLFLPFSKGLFIDNYYSMLLQGILNEIYSRKYALTLFDSNLLSKDFSEPLREGQIDGLLIVCPPEQQLKNLLPYARQVVFLSATYQKIAFSTVDCDNLAGAETVTDYLIGLGHNVIGFIGGPEDNANAGDRFKGFCLSHQKKGMQIDSELIANGEFVYSQAVKAARKLLALKPRPTALFCANDTMAFAAMQVCRELKLDIPEDVSIVGFDDVDMAAETQPLLTTVKQPIAEIGTKGTKMLFDQLDAKVFEPKNLVFPVELVVRESCRKI